MSPKKSGLAVVQQLYFLQMELSKFVKQTEVDDQALKQIKEYMKEFTDLLHQADWKYMGGEDVYEALEVFEKEMKVQLKSVKRTAQVSKTKK